jgi:N-acetylmuramoyl-L-alanine amidase
MGNPDRHPHRLETTAKTAREALVIAQVTRLVAACLVLSVACASTRAQDAPEAPPANHTVAPASAEADEPSVIAARVGGDKSQTRIVFDLSRKIDMRAFALADPYRLVIDLPQVRFQLPPQAGDTGKGLVKAFRFGLMKKGGSRIVLDLTAPVRLDKSFVLDPADGQPARLVLDLSAIDRPAFLREVAFDNRPRTDLGAAAKPANDGAGATNDSRPVIVLDPGHGGIDEGAHAATGEAEKNVALDFALMLRDKLAQSGKYRVEMTRSDDTFIALTDRVQFARAHRAQLFISLHCDALARGEGDAQGATVYTLSDHASDAEAARLAEAENRADIIAGVDLSSEPNEIADILIDLAQRETRSFTTHFARALVGDLKNAIRLHKQPLRSAGFRVLKAPDVPSVLIELGFVSNRADFKELMSETWRARAADSITHAVNDYFSRRMAGAAGAVGRE